ncbi:MAG: metallophosphoesterase [Planctomycetes bacterium]|nr:metallophosphoesterase [Planctomycetota bacterium]
MNGESVIKTILNRSARRSRLSRRLRRRQRLRKLVSGTLMTAAFTSIVDVLAVEPRWTKVKTVDVPIPNLPPSWEGVRIVQLTDLHVGKFVSLDYIRKIVRKTNSLSPDVVVLTGDYISQTGAITDDFARVLSGLRTRYGKFGVLGNHDHWEGAQAVRQLLRKAGITDLTNKSVLLERAGEHICLAGVDDLWTSHQDLSGALKGVPEDVPRILLSHNPDYAEEMPAEPRVDLMLCGHTHGGQFKVPFGSQLWLPIRHSKYAAGLVKGPHCLVYTSVGVGMVGLPIRFNCRPEISLIILR